MGARRALLAIVCLLLLRTGIGLALIRAVPAWEAFDEPGHFGYAVTLVTQGRLPYPDDQPPNPERIQPPLVYMVLAGFLQLSGSDVSGYRFPEQNPHFYFNAHQIAYALHPPDPTPDDQRIETALIVSRAFLLLLTLPGVALTYRAAHTLWPEYEVRCVTATAIFALWPQFTFNGSMISNDGAVTVLGAALTWRLLVLHKKPTVRNSLIALGLIGLGLLIKLNALALISGFIVAVLLSRSVRLILTVGGLTMIVLVGGIVFLRQIPGVLLPFFNVDAAGQTGLSALWKHLADPQTPEFVQRMFANTLNTSLGNFGWGQFFFPEWVQPIYVIALLLAMIGLAIRFIRRDSVGQMIILLSLLIGLCFVGLALALFYQLVYWLPGRYLLPGLGAASLLIVGGLAAFGPHRHEETSPPVPLSASGEGEPVYYVGLPRSPLSVNGEGPGVGLIRIGSKIGAGISLLFLIGLTTLNLMLPAYLSGYFVPLPTSDIATEQDIPHYGPGEMAPGMQILGYRLVNGSAVPGGEIVLEAYWQADQAISKNYTVRVEVLGPDGQNYGLYETYPRGGVYPTSQWQPGAIFKDRYRVPLAANFPAPAQAILSLSVYDEVYRTQLNGGFKRTRVLDDIPLQVKQP